MKTTKTTNQFSASTVMRDAMTKAVNETKKESENIIGFIDYDLKFVDAECYGKAISPRDPSPIEKSIMGILMINESTSCEEMGRLLGLDIIHDYAEREFLDEHLDDLQNNNCINNIDKNYRRERLTKEGKVYAEIGMCPEKRDVAFDLFIDFNHPSWTNLKDAIGQDSELIVDDEEAIFQNRMYVECEFSTRPCYKEPNLSITEIKKYAKYQCPDIHCPKEYRHLINDGTDWRCLNNKIYKTHICLVQSISDNTKIHAYVFNTNGRRSTPMMEQYINSDGKLVAELFKGCTQIVREHF